MTPPAEYKQYMDMLGFEDFEEPYTITAGTRVYRFRSMDWSVPDIAYSWEGITAALEAARILDAEGTTKDLVAVKNVVEGLASSFGIYLEGFFPMKVWERIKFNIAMMAR